MKIAVEKEISCCNDCPYFKEHVDTSVCYDSLDEPNYDWYCKHPDADNGKDKVDIRCQDFGCRIGGAWSYGTKCQIPNWCPFKKEE